MSTGTPLEFAPGTVDLDSETAYQRIVQRLGKTKGRDAALRLAVGGDFDAVGSLEYALLRSLGLKDGQLVIDIGCGSGRLACKLAPMQSLRYIGTDVVPELLSYANEICERPDWTFIQISGERVPVPDESADFVCFFSVLTHLLLEQSFRYLRDAKRALKPGGLIVASFLEFKLPCHWNIFIDSVNSPTAGRQLNQFIDREAIHSWAKALDLEILAFHDGDKPHIPLEKPVLWDNGYRMTEHGNLGQSVVVLRKPQAAKT